MCQKVRASLEQLVGDGERIGLAILEASFDTLDGLTIDLPDGSWANLRPSNTEPLLRLNVEARTPERMAELRDQVLAIVRS